MPRGGARPNSGPPPAEHSQKKDREAARAARAPKNPDAPPTAAAPKPSGSSRVIDDGEWWTLAREGRTANAPAWPLTRASARERALWNQMWKRPVALGWERAGAEFQVAMHVRTLVRAEKEDSAIGLANQVRLQQHELGLTPLGLKMLKWRIGQPPRAQTAGEQPSSAGPAPASAASLQQRPGLHVVHASGA